MRSLRKNEYLRRRKKSGSPKRRRSPKYKKRSKSPKYRKRKHSRSPVRIYLRSSPKEQLTPILHKITSNELQGLYDSILPDPAIKITLQYLGQWHANEVAKFADDEAKVLWCAKQKNKE